MRPVKRKPISKKTRFEVFKRDLFQCQYCGKRPPNALLEVDHIMPVAEGGTNRITNLATSCFECNRGKSNRPLKTVPEGLECTQFYEAEKLQQLSLLNEYLRDAENELDDRVNEAWHRIASGMGYEEGPKDVYVSVRIWMRKGILGFDDFAHAADVTVSRCGKYRDDWKYFCGVCHEIIRQKRDL